MPTRKSYCRICGAWCAIKVDVQDNKVIAIHGDKDDPETKGFTCTKGRQIPFQMNESKRLLTSLARNENGTLETIDYQQAVRRIASKLQQIIDRHGPRSVAVYCGTHGWFNSAFIPVVRAWLDKLGSPNYYSSLTVDCPAQFTAKARAGHWAGGHHSFKSADVVLMAGRNPLVSNLSSTLGGLPGSNPGRLLKDARQRGLKLICVDPRESDLAKRADIHLQLKPGEDASLFAGLIHVILQEDLHDQAFCERWVDGLNTLRNAVQAFTPEYAALRAEVPVEKLVEAARLFARGPRGCASGGLGTEMSRHAELNHYLILALNIICGRFNRQGERVANPGVLLPPGPLFEGTLPKEQLPSIMSFGTGEQPRVRGLKSICGEMPCNGLADEILTPGDGQVRAFICVGGNPVLAFPDTDKTIRAMKDLELLVCVDPHRSATAALADYVIAPKLPLERDDLTVLGDANYEQPYAHYAPAVVDAAPELVEEWEFILDLAAEMGTDITINEERVAIDTIFSKYPLLEIITRGSRVPISHVRDGDGGQVFHDEEAGIVQTGIEGVSGKFNLRSEELYAQLASLEKAPDEVNPDYPFMLVNRRLREVANSVGQDFPVVQKLYQSNPIFIHPRDMQKLGIAEDDMVTIRSEHGRVTAISSTDDSIKPGVVAMSHCWGMLDESLGRVVGANVNQLTNNAVNFSKNTGMPVMTGIEVGITRMT